MSENRRRRLSGCRCDHNAFVRCNYLRGLLVSVSIAASLEAQTPADAEKPSAKGLTPESVILNLPAGPGEAPLPVTLRQMMSIYRVPGSSSEKPQEFKLNSETGESRDGKVELHCESPVQSGKLTRTRPDGSEGHTPRCRSRLLTTQFAGVTRSLRSRAIPIAAYSLRSDRELGGFVHPMAEINPKNPCR